MAGIQKGSSDNLTSPIPHLLNADFLTAVARLAPGLIHYAGRDYYQRDTDTHYRLKALSKCFAADGTTPATLPGTWGTLEAHWVTAASAAAAPTNGTNGTNGNRILALAAAPALSDGNLADLAIVSAVGDLYEKTSSGWALRGNLRGPAGTGGTGTATSGVTAFNTRVGSVTLTAADVLSVVSSANQLAGGLHSAANKANMLAIPATLRDYGMTVIVYADLVTANNGRYDLATDLQTWIKQGIDLSGQFQPYNAGLLYNTASAYVTYPDPVSSALRIFHSLALAAPAVQPAPVNSSNALNAAWEEISPSAAAATRIPLYNNPGTATDGPMTQAATTTALGLKVDKVTGLALSSNDYTSTEKAKLAALATVATSGSYPDLLNKPAFLAAAANLSDLISAPTARQNLGLNGILLMTQPTGEHVYFADFESAQIAANPGAVIAFGPGTFGDPSVSVTLRKDLSIILSPNTTWTFSSLFLHVYNQPTTRQVSIFGSGTGRLVGAVASYGPITVNCLLSSLRHEGSIFYSSYLAVTNEASRFVLQNVTGVCTSAVISNGQGTMTVTDYIRVAPTDKPCLIEVYNSSISASIGAAYNNSAGAPVTNAVANTLRIYRSTISSPGSAIVAASGVVTFDFAQVAYQGSLNANVASTATYSFLGMPTGGTGTAYTAGVGIAISGVNVISATGTGGAVQIDYLNPVLITAAATLQAGRSHRATGTGGYTLTMPDPTLTPGAQLFIAISNTSTGLFPLSGTTIVMQATEAVVLLATPDGWKRTAGVPLRTSMRVSTTTTTITSLVVGNNTTIPFVNVDRQRGEISLNGNSIVIARAGSGTFEAAIILSNLTAGGYYQAVLQQTKANAAQIVIAISLVLAVSPGGGQVLGILSLSAKCLVDIGDRLAVIIYSGSGGQLRSDTPSQPNTMTFTED